MSNQLSSSALPLLDEIMWTDGTQLSDSTEFNNDPHLKVRSSSDDPDYDIFTVTVCDKSGDEEIRRSIEAYRFFLRDRCKIDSLET